MGRDLGHHGGRGSPLPRRRRPVPGAHRRPAGGRDRPRRAVLRRHPAGLRGPAHRPGEPAGAGGEARRRDEAGATRHACGAHALRPRRAEGHQRHARPPCRRSGAETRGRGAGSGRVGLSVRRDRPPRRRRVRRDTAGARGAEARDLGITALQLLAKDRDMPFAISCGAVEAGPGLEYAGHCCWPPTPPSTPRSAGAAARYAPRRPAPREFAEPRGRSRRRGPRSGWTPRLGRFWSCSTATSAIAARSTASKPRSPISPRPSTRPPGRFPSQPTAHRRFARFRRPTTVTAVCVASVSGSGTRCTS